jgi:hypothetical protein
MRTKILIAVLGVIAMVGWATPAQAIVNGQPDDGEHPFVGELFFYVPDSVDSRFTDPGGWFTCTGTLVDPTTVLTAGHCVYGVGKDGKSTTKKGGDGSGGNDVWISFEAAPDFDIVPPSVDYIPDRNQQRYEDRNDVLDASTEWHDATAYAHPEYNDAAFYLNDLGVLVLDEPVYMSEYGELPELGLLDELGERKSKEIFEAVGYGLEGAKLNSSFGGDTRRKAQQRLVNLKGVGGAGGGISAKFSSNRGKNTSGGTCFGDSGGPIFHDDSNVIVAVTSYGISPTCSDGTGGYRVDQRDDLRFLATFGITPG